MTCQWRILSRSDTTYSPHNLASARVSWLYSLLSLLWCSPWWPLQAQNRDNPRRLWDQFLPILLSTRLVPRAGRHYCRIWIRHMCVDWWRSPLLQMLEERRSVIRSVVFAIELLGLALCNKIYVCIKMLLRYRESQSSQEKVGDFPWCLYAGVASRCEMWSRSHEVWVPSSPSGDFPKKKDISQEISGTQKHNSGATGLFIIWAPVRRLTVLILH